MNVEYHNSNFTIDFTFTAMTERVSLKQLQIAMKRLTDRVIERYELEHDYEVSAE